MLTCLETGTNERINIIREIGTNYHSLGTHLLQDKTGARVANISENRRPEEATREILRQWLEGSGQEPVTWRTLTEALAAQTGQGYQSCENVSGCITHV